MILSSVEGGERETEGERGGGGSGREKEGEGKRERERERERVMTNCQHTPLYLFSLTCFQSATSPHSLVCTVAKCSHPLKDDYSR